MAPAQLGYHYQAPLSLLNTEFKKIIIFFTVRLLSHGCLPWSEDCTGICGKVGQSPTLLGDTFCFPGTMQDSLGPKVSLSFYFLSSLCPRHSPHLVLQQLSALYSWNVATRSGSQARFSPSLLWLGQLHWFLRHTNQSELLHNDQSEPHDQSHWPIKTVQIGKLNLHRIRPIGNLGGDFLYKREPPRSLCGANFQSPLEAEVMFPVCGLFTWRSPFLSCLFIWRNSFLSFLQCLAHSRFHWNRANSQYFNDYKKS